MKTFLRTWPKNALTTYTRGLNTKTTTLEKDLRHLMLQAAQPVVVVTTRFREGGGVFRVPEDENHNERGNDSTCRDDSNMSHGATLSSFASVAMHPYPIVSFSLQLPSRLAAALITMRNTVHRNQDLPDFVINILSSKQADLAHRFSRPDLHPHPFRSLPPDRYSFVDGQPVLSGSIGSISCTVISSINLQTLEDSMTTSPRNTAKVERTSNLFLAKVLRIEGFHEPKENEEGNSPLVYHQKKFMTVK